MAENTPVNIVQIGYGYWGTNVARNIMQSQKTNMTALSDAVPARLKAAENVYGSAIPDYTTDYEKYLDDPKVDAFALVIQTEPSFEVAKKILKAGKHLFIEKPMASDTARAEELNRLAHENHVVLHTDHIMIFHPIIRYIKKMYDEGVLGDLIYFDISRMNLGPIRRDVNAMLDLVKQETERIDSTFLEPACGTGNFLVEILRRKLAVVQRVYFPRRGSCHDYELQAMKAVMSIYGVDLLQDNVEACRERLFKIFDAYFRSVTDKYYRLIESL